VIVVRLFVLLGVLGFVVLGAGCASPRPELENGGSDSSGGTGNSSGGTGDSSGGTGDSSGGTGDSSGSTGDSSGSTGAEVDTNVDDTGAPVCGNGIVEAGESCDDGAETALCNVDCTPVACGDGVVNEAASEECDDGGKSATCNLDCTVAECGDGIVNPLAGETCDDGGAMATCDLDCTPVACGDGVVNDAAGEECDDGGRSATCDWDCTVAECGDGLVNALAGEACDTAGRTAACGVDCSLVECGDGITHAAAGEACDDAGETATCNADCSLAICGDGIANAASGEACDDAGMSATCDEDCSLAVCGDGDLNVTAGEVCDAAGESSTCNADCTVAECGDEIVNVTAGEQCDDAGETATCDVDCTTPACGDGDANAAAGEQCDGLDLGGLGCGDVVALGGALGCSAGCAYETAGCTLPLLQLSFSPIKQFDFSWAAVPDAEYYQVLESASPGEPYVQIGGDIVGEAVSFEMPLHFRWQASYVLRACNAGGCTDSEPVDVVESLAEAVGYVKASNTGAFDEFGYSVALSGDGNTLAVGAHEENSNATGIGGNQADNSVVGAGAVYVFERDGAGAWSQQAYVKASSTGEIDHFGGSVALSGDGNTLAVGARNESSNATGIGGNPANNSASGSGAVYVFERDGAGAWSQQAYVKASNTDFDHEFGYSVALSGDGNTLAVGARNEGSNATGIGGNQADNSASYSGAVYVFERDGAGAWSQQAYVKASNTGASDLFGLSVALSGNGNTLAVGAYGEDSNATDIGGNQADNSASASGAVYVFERDGAGAWSQQAYVKASNTGANDYFGVSVSLSGDGNTLAVGAYLEDSNATSIGGNQADNSASSSGAVYLY
jgi:hypothetical protein